MDARRTYVYVLTIAAVKLRFQEFLETSLVASDLERGLDNSRWGFRFHRRRGILDKEDDEYSVWTTSLASPPALCSY